MVRAKISQWFGNRGNPTLVGLLVLTVAIRFLFIFYTTDDAYITFRYARNLAAGLGFVYNAGEPVLGTTTPLYTLVLAGLARLGFDFVALGKSLNILADAGTALILYSATRRILPSVVALASMFLFAVSPTNVYFAATGMETGIYLFLTTWLLWLYSQVDKLAKFSARQVIRLGIVASCLVMVRPDGLLAVGAVGIAWLIRRENYRAGLIAVLIFLIMQLPWLLFAQYYFGSPIPQSITAKALTYQAATTSEWAMRWVDSIAQREGWLGAMLAAVLFLAGILAILRDQAKRVFLPFVLWFFVYVIAFSLARAGAFSWYYAPLMPFVFLFLTIGAYTIYQCLTMYALLARTFGILHQRWFGGLVFAIAVLLTISSLLSVWDDAQAEGAFEQSIARPLGVWLNQHAPPDAQVALESIGAVGWHSNCYILDEGGLVSKSVYKLNQRTAGTVNVMEILQTFQPAYYIAWESWELSRLVEPADSDWFATHYREQMRLTDGYRAWIFFVRSDVNLE
jgi:hypothetical protein